MLLIKVSTKLKVKCFLIRYFSYTQTVSGQHKPTFVQKFNFENRTTRFDVATD